MRHEHAVLGGQACATDVLHQSLAAAPVGGNLLDAEQGKTVALRETLQVPAAHHAPIVTDDLA
jgi:hypothetical protein